MYPETFYYEKPKRNRKKIFIIMFVIFLVLIIPIIIFTRDREQKQAQLIEPNGIVTITYDGEEGFKPKYLKIKKGTRVVWSNQDSVYNKSMQVVANASENDQVVDFGSQTGVAMGGTYTYTFDKETTMTYRNEAEPTQNGTIEVSNN
jgi:plastocyanin